MSTKLRNILSVVTLVGLCAVVTLAQGPSPAAPSLTLTATSANVTGAGERIEFYINRWSADADRDKLSAAWKVSPPPPATAGRAGDGAAPAAGRAGRGGGRGGAAAPAAPRTPEAALATALKDLTPAGYFWTSEVGGYVIRYAARTPTAGGGSRIILITDKRLGAAKNNWQPAPPGGTANAYEFSLIELRIPAKGDGEGKASITGTITIDSDTKGVALDGYDALPVTLRGVKARTEA